MPDSDDNIFAARLLYARDTLRHLTQLELAQKAGLPSTSISHFENPKGTRKPSFDNLRRLANALEVTTDYLIGLSDDHVGMPVADELYRDMQNLTDQDKALAQHMIKKLLENNLPKD